VMVLALLILRRRRPAAEAGPATGEPPSASTEGLLSGERPPLESGGPLVERPKEKTP